MGSLLLTLLALTIEVEQTCTHTKKAHFNASSIQICSIEEPKMQSKPQDDWRRPLQQHLESSAKTNHRDLSFMFAYVCQDLESHCNNVEEQLRTERDRFVPLQQ